MMRITNEMWINDKYYHTVGCLRAKDCDNNKENFKKVLQEELMEEVQLIQIYRRAITEYKNVMILLEESMEIIVICLVKKEREQHYTTLQLMKL